MKLGIHTSSYFICIFILHTGLCCILLFVYTGISYCVFSGPLVPGEATWKKSTIVKSDWKCHLLSTPSLLCTKDIRVLHAVRILFNGNDSSVPNVWTWNPFLHPNTYYYPKESMLHTICISRNNGYTVMWQLDHGAGQNANFFDDANA